MKRATAVVLTGAMLWITGGLTPEAGAARADGARLDADFRFRYERIDQEGREAYDRHRIRVRLGLEGAAGDHAHYTVRLASGSADPISTNQTLGGGFSTKRIFLDRAFAGIRPPLVRGLELLAGKMASPFMRPGGSQLLYDGDLSPEGVAGTYRHVLGRLSLFGAGSGFVVENRRQDDDAFLYGAQAGFTYAPEGTAWKATAGASLYAYTEIEGTPAAAGDPVFDPAYGNSTSMVDSVVVIAAGFTLVEAFFEAELELEDMGGLRKLPVLLYGDLVKNTEPEEEATGWMAGVLVRPWKLKLGYNYRRLERDAVLAAFSDSDFAGGGTNAEGHQLIAGAKLLQGLDLNVSFFLNRLQIAAGEKARDYERLQIDLTTEI
ncbi:MAG: hypothetical protein GF355_06885 [Candidatus Eisenbacteria bacterium]|nr:hypothetical protein [Candidatus Eisenbacteria bacterium]